MSTVKEKNRLEERFQLWDNNGDGVVDRSDFEAEAEEIVRKFGEQNSPKGQALTDAYVGMWDHLSQQSGKNSMTLDEFLQVADQEIISKGDSGFARVTRPTIEAIVNLLDTDGDREVSPDEFKRWIDAIGVQSVDGADMFAELDTNGSGSLTIDELVQAVQDYHLGRHDVPLLGR